MIQKIEAVVGSKIAHSYQSMADSKMRIYMNCYRFKERRKLESITTETKSTRICHQTSLPVSNSEHMVLVFKIWMQSQQIGNWVILNFSQSWQFWHEKNQQEMQSVPPNTKICLSNLATETNITLPNSANRILAFAVDHRVSLPS